MKKNTNMLERLRHYRLMVSYAARQKQKETADKTGKRNDRKGAGIRRQRCLLF